MLHALQVGSPPAWDNVPEEFQADIAAWQIVHSRKTAADMERYNILLEGNQSNTLTDAERLELMALRNEADRFMLFDILPALIPSGYSAGFWGNPHSQFLHDEFAREDQRLRAPAPVAILSLGVNFQVPLGIF
jgi:hypothetical protein